jgi:glucose 1-dehydrogenase
VASAPFALHPEPARLLIGRRALVTGASSGIGAGVSYELAAHGASVAVTHRPGNEADAAAIVDAIEGGGGRAMAAPLDVTDEEGVREAFATARDAFGGVDLLVNNAGIESRYALVDLPLAEWREVLDVNLTGAFLCSREAARLMLAEPTRGAIVNISSVHEVIPWPRFSHYCASKGGMKLFAETIARELAPHGIRVVGVAPGAIATPINRDVLADPQQKQAVLDQVPYGRWGTVEDVARAVAWIASEQADYVVGASLFVDGGMTLYPEFD